MLGQLRRVLGDIGQGRRGDPSKGYLWLLHAKDKLLHGTSLYNGLCKLGRVRCDESKRPNGRLLHRRVELFEAGDEGVQRTTLHHSLSQLRRVLGNCTQNKCGGFFVESVLLRKRIHELR